ncbi:zinc-dependent metalloprotease [Acidicapsa dinghuensis]|uniref:Zinc-dependent metalloprotease n=1 Tax=Acidicapsa dinghuensis TaxID=2218256 RepID=A0ABW1EB93_9BACT|nr:zinc-dependent metalloprotease [Acidicapsa dinghuensis]
MLSRSLCSRSCVVVVALAVFTLPSLTFSESPQTFAQKIAGMDHKDGLFPFDWDAKNGKLYLEIPKTDEDVLLLDQLPYGMGSNDIGLDRGQLGQGRVVHFTRVGNKVLLIQPNLEYRSSSSDADQRLDVKESFPESVLWGFKVEAEDNGRLLVDATDFFLRDAHGVTERVAQAKQGSYRLDASRSAITLDNTKNFPKNTEIEAILTFVSEGQPHGEYVASVTPDPHAITVREHTSLIELPGPGYTPRYNDPRSGFFSVEYRDYSAPLGEPLEKHLLVRHRLIKRDPNAAVSEPVQPIVYYVDRGAPEPIRSALVEGANWWSAAFEATGFKNAFKVEVLPEGADPMDIRYNMIQWVHRATRGWSYGEAVADPRTGEIIKGQVTLGSLRSRQDYKIAEALLAPYMEGKPIPPDMEQMVLARTRQLAAHEVGHTLGLEHNFAASSVAPGTSVMDYPHPWITLDAEGRPTLANAYTTGVGAWDKAAITYGYSQFAPGTDEKAALNKLLEDEDAQGLRFISDADSRPLGSANPYGHLWDNGPDAALELERILKVRRAALDRFGEDAIRIGEPMSNLEDTLVPLYLLHRYQTEAASKLIGGLDYRYAVRGDHGMVTRMIAPAEQRKALEAVLHTLEPTTLTLSPEFLVILPPNPPGYPRTRESFEGYTGLTFDPNGAVEAAANLTASLLFEPTRASRLVEFHAINPTAPSLQEVIQEIIQNTWQTPRLPGLSGQTQYVVERVVLNHLMQLAASQQASPQARAIATQELSDLEAWLNDQLDMEVPEGRQAHWSAAVDDIERFWKDPSKFEAPKELATPPGQPIGEDEEDFSVN